MSKEISLTQFFEKKDQKNHVTIDVRSPQEFSNATIPGSINIPIFTDQEREIVGTLYKQVGKTAAKKRGLEIFSEKLPQFIQAFESLPEDKTIFCWRGGMRSKTAVTVLDLMGIHAQRLHGGYRTYRQFVVNYLANEPIRPELYVLNGFTGTGKTEILKALEARGYPVIDLEAMAGHRGSIFGQIGNVPHKQKKFDSLLYEKLSGYQAQPFIFVEGESKRIGRALIPDLFYDKKQNGRQYYIDLPIEKRIDIILKDYHPESHHKQILEAYGIIKKRIKQEVAKDIERYLIEKNYAQAVQLLLEYYYDPRYDHAHHAIKSNEQFMIKANNLVSATEQIIKTL